MRSRWPHQLGVSPDILFKTLVARGGPDDVFVFCIPGNADLDLKKAARVTGRPEGRARRAEGPDAPDGVRARRVLPDRHEEEVSHVDRRDRLDAGEDVRERRRAGMQVILRARGPASRRRGRSTATSCSR